jgi:hypothetical protein
MTGAGPTGTVTGTFGRAGAGGYKARAGYADVNRPRSAVYLTHGTVPDRHELHELS